MITILEINVLMNILWIIGEINKKDVAFLTNIYDRLNLYTIHTIPPRRHDKEQLYTIQFINQFLDIIQFKLVYIKSFCLFEICLYFCSVQLTLMWAKTISPDIRYRMQIIRHQLYNP